MEIKSLTKLINIDVDQILLAVGILVIAWLFQRYILKNGFQKLIGFMARRNWHFRVHLATSYELPVRHAVVFLSAFISLFILLGIPIKDQEVFSKLVKSVCILYSFLGMYRLLAFYSLNPQELSLVRKSPTDSVLLPFFCRFGKFIVMGIAFVLLCYDWGYDVNGLVAGLGIGGVAIALGSKDVLSNMFGGVAIAMDKPFSRGDWISTQDRKIEGLVEEVNFRSTKLLTFDKALLYIPNTYLANQPIINWTRRDVRRFMFQLAIDPDTPESKIRKTVSRLKESISEYAGVETDSSNVFIDEITEVGYMLKVAYFTNTAEYDEAMHTKQEVSFIVGRIFREEQIKLSPVNQQMTWNRVV